MLLLGLKKYVEEELMKVKFHGEEFQFDVTRSDEILQGFIQLNSEKKERLLQLCKAEEELEEKFGPWYLDRNGERLSQEELFSKSPWSVCSPNGVIKLLCRFQDNQTGESHFNTQEGYLGELFEWVR
jgi:hypothetical protein